jgi:signal transduction histidine kinase
MCELTEQLRVINERLIVAGLREHQRSEERAELLERSEEANRVKASFLARVSHELRTPLNSILGYAELLTGQVAGQLNPKQREHVARIEAGTHHLIDLIEEILSFARLDAGRERLFITTADASSLAREAADLVEPLAQQAGLSFDLSTPSAALPMETDAPKVRQILLNLLSNAIKFTEAGGVRLEVTRGLSQVVFTVRDTGVGIASDKREHIFEPFRQLTTRIESGTGLGLSVSRQLARLLGGELTVESIPQKGSAFILRLPPRSLPNT